jgi:hypothetical protein
MSMLKRVEFSNARDHVSAHRIDFQLEGPAVISQSRQQVHGAVRECGCGEREANLCIQEGKFIKKNIVLTLSAG